jgi:dolichol-phosphate mannosyltransferase
MFGVFLIYNYFTGQIEVRGYTSIVVLISFFAGISISMLGLIGEYLWRIFENLSQIPESVIEKIEEKRSK